MLEGMARRTIEVLANAVRIGMARRAGGPGVPELKIELGAYLKDSIPLDVKGSVIRFA